MEYPSVKQELPKSGITLEAKFVNHYDLSLGFIGLTDQNKTRFQFAWGSEQTIFGAIVCYLALLGNDPLDSIKANPTAKAWEEDSIWLNTEQKELIKVATGKILKYSQPDHTFGTPLCLPIPVRPGVLDDVGGNGLYMHTNQSDTTFRLVGIPPLGLTEKPQRIIDLPPDDALVTAQAMIELSGILGGEPYENILGLLDYLKRSPK